MSLHRHGSDHAFASLQPRELEGVTVLGRRSMLKAGLAGMAGLSLPGLLAAKEQSVATSGQSPRQKSVILVWMTGGPSHIDTLDMKPSAPIDEVPFRQFRPLCLGCKFASTCRFRRRCSTR